MMGLQLIYRSTSNESNLMNIYAKSAQDSTEIRTAVHARLAKKSQLHRSPVLGLYVVEFHESTTKTTTTSTGWTS
jgi:hypothetical protein